MKNITMMLYVSAALSVAAIPSPICTSEFTLQRQSFTPPHKKNRRGKLKRSGR